MKALILNNQVVQVELNEFPVAAPLTWVVCPDICTTEWGYDGTTFIEPQPIVPTIEELSENVRKALQQAIDIKAQSFGFSGGNALMLYAGFTNAFQTLAQTFATWEANVWVEADAYKAQVLEGTKPMLTPEEAVALMPVYPV